MRPSRRDFLRRTGCALSGAALISGLDRFGLVNALAQPNAAGDYKALVCIFFFGGNDGNNVVIPYDDYHATGGYGDKRGTLAIPQADLLQIKPASDSRTFGLHP